MEPPAAGRLRPLRPATRAPRSNSRPRRLATRGHFAVVCRFEQPAVVPAGHFPVETPCLHDLGTITRDAAQNSLFIMYVVPSSDCLSNFQYLHKCLIVILAVITNGYCQVYVVILYSVILSTIYLLSFTSAYICIFIRLGKQNKLTLSAIEFLWWCSIFDKSCAMSGCL